MVLSDFNFRAALNPRNPLEASPGFSSHFHGHVGLYCSTGCARRSQGSRPRRSAIGSTSRPQPCAITCRMPSASSAHGTDSMPYASRETPAGFEPDDDTRAHRQEHRIEQDEWPIGPSCSSCHPVRGCRRVRHLRRCEARRVLAHKTAHPRPMDRVALRASESST